MKLQFILIIFSISLFASCKDSSMKISKSIDLYLPDDLEATLWAASPMFHNPTNMDVDYKGRIWITEAVDYRNYNNDSTKFLHHPQGDRVIILEDTDGDGQADSSKVFVQDKDLVSPLGIAVIGNKIIVSCSPNMIIYTDGNGDDKPDKKEIFLTGFGGLDHDHSLHAVYAGPDGNWYFNTGNAGPHNVKDKSGWTLRSGSVYTGGSPYNTKNAGLQKSDDGKVWVGGLALRIKPDGAGLKVMAHNFRNAYEVIPDSYGNLWQNDNDDQVVTCRTTWIMEGGNAGYFSADGTRYWQADQRPGQDIFNAHWHQDDPGVMPAGDRSGAGAPAGITINEGGALGKKYLGMVFSADAGRNVIFGYHPFVKQSGYDLGTRENFVSSLLSDNPGYVWNDTSEHKLKEKWFRPSDVTIGTDGALYIADWYDPVVGGHQMQDRTGHGRIYRIAPKNKKLSSPKIDLHTIDGQIAAFTNPAINVRNAGYEKLKQQGEQVLRRIVLLTSSENPFVAARSIWLLSKLGAGGIGEVEKMLSNANPLFRATAYRAMRQVVPDILPYARPLANDTSAFVRREVILSLENLPYENMKPLLLELIKGYDGEDRWYLEALGTALAGHESDIYPEIKKLLAKSQYSKDWNSNMANLAWRLHPSESLPDLLDRVRDNSIPIKERLNAITAIAFINDRNAVSAMVELSKFPSKEVSEMAAYWLSFRRSNDWVDLIDWRKVDVNTKYQRILATMKVKKQIVLDELQSRNERKWRVQEMALDSVGGQMLIGMAAEKQLPELLLPFIEEKIFQNPDATIRLQAGNYFKRPGAGKLMNIGDILKLHPDVEKGRSVFGTRCATCHKVGGEGSTAGPDLTSIAKKFNDPELVDAIINPSAAIVFGYEPWLVNTKDGQSLYGFIVSENNRTIVLKDVSGKQHTIFVNNISSKRKESKSLMPDPVANGITEQDLADVVGYLKEAAARRK